MKSENSPLSSGTAFIEFMTATLKGWDTAAWVIGLIGLGIGAGLGSSLLISVVIGGYTVVWVVIRVWLFALRTQERRRHRDPQ